MYIVIGIVLFVALAAGWDAYGPKAVLKAIGWTVGGAATLLVLISVIVSIHNAR